jgi:hypothetical protein
VCQQQCSVTGGRIYQRRDCQRKRVISFDRLGGTAPSGPPGAIATPGGVAHVADSSRGGVQSHGDQAGEAIQPVGHGRPHDAPEHIA